VISAILLLSVLFLTMLGHRPDPVTMAIERAKKVDVTDIPGGYLIPNMNAGPVNYDHMPLECAALSISCVTSILKQKVRYLQGYPDRRRSTQGHFSVKACNSQAHPQTTSSPDTVERRLGEATSGEEAFWKIQPWCCRNTSR
jgi:hypothetical protein